jgi:transcriptional regulator of heat shock response
MKITERQGKLLNMIVKEYIDSAQPVSSQLLEKKYDFDISPATIRIEMQKLTDKGFLLQPHTSAGRIPTDKGYRLFVDELLGKEPKESGVEDWFESEVEDTFKFIQSLTRHIAEETRALTLSYLEKENLFWTEGWEEVLREPEFEERDFLINFTNFLKTFENHIGELKDNSNINVYIGKENPLPKAKDFAVISSRYRLPNGEEGVISILGPKRMEYDKNISLINSLVKLLDNF